MWSMIYSVIMLFLIWAISDYSLNPIEVVIFLMVGRMYFDKYDTKILK